MALEMRQRFVVQTQVARRDHTLENPAHRCLSDTRLVIGQSALA
jgi:hypothetical protein